MKSVWQILGVSSASELYFINFPLSKISVFGLRFVSHVDGVRVCVCLNFLKQFLNSGFLIWTRIGLNTCPRLVRYQIAIRSENTWALVCTSV